MRIEISRINGDVYVNGDKVLFAVDFNNPPTATPQYTNVDWLLGWAKIGMISRGHTVTHFDTKPLADYEAQPKPPLEAA